LDQSNIPFPLTSDQFEHLVSMIESAAAAAVSRALQQNSVLLGVAERGYVNDKASAKLALVGKV